MEIFAEGMVARQVIVFNDLGQFFASRMFSKLAINFSITFMLSIGAMASRAIYTSKELSRRNPTYHGILMRMGYLNLLYFLVEDMIRPFEDATALYHSDRFAFNEVTNEFIKNI